MAKSVDWNGGDVGVYSLLVVSLFGGSLCPDFVEILPAFAEVSLLYTSSQEFRECLVSDRSPTLTPETGWEAGQIELTLLVVLL